MALPALTNLMIWDVEWPSMPQHAVLALPSSRPALTMLSLSFTSRAFALQLLKWLACTPSKSTLKRLHYSPDFNYGVHRLLDDGGLHELGHYLQQVARNIGDAHLDLNHGLCTWVILTFYGVRFRGTLINPLLTNMISILQRPT